MGEKDLAARYFREAALGLLQRPPEEVPRPPRTIRRETTW
jgi:hypothetical protein